MAALVVVALLAAATVPAAATTGDDGPSLRDERELGSTSAPGDFATQQGQRQRACDYQALFEEVGPSVVTFRVSNETGDFAVGSGWVYDRNDSTAHVLTNWHVIANATGGVRNATGVDVQFSEGQWRTGTVIGADPTTDLAVVAVDDPPAYADALSLSESPPEPGQEIANVGAPLGLSGSISPGVVNAVNRSLTIPTARGGPTVVHPNAIQFDAAAPGGSSGSPMVDCEGNVIGVQAAGVRFEDVNFAVAASTVRQVVPELVENGVYRHSFLGVSYPTMLTMSPTLARVNDVNVTRGVLVVDVIGGSPADGTLRESSAIDRRTRLPVGGDVIVSIDGRRISSEGDLIRHLFERTAPGDTVEMTVLRRGELRTVAVTLDGRPAETPANETPAADESTPSPEPPAGTETASPPDA
jgi:S1-C subfamily serine protease